MSTSSYNPMSSMSRSRVRNSVMQVASLKPEFEFEVIKLVLLRENYIQRLKRKLESDNGCVDMTIIGLCDVLRDVSVDIVETIRKWERTQVDYPKVKPFTWNGLNYLMKMIDDLNFLSDYPKVRSWMGFELENNMFLVPPELLLPAITVPEDSYLVFGARPDKSLDEVKKPKKVKALRSPYLTPIINDVNIFPALSKAAKFEKSEKKKAKSGILPSSEVESLKEKTNTDPYETFLSSAMMQKIRKCWEVLCSRKANLLEKTLSLSFSNLQIFGTSEWSTGFHDTSMVSDLGHTYAGNADLNSRNSSEAYAISSSQSLTEVTEPATKSGRFTGEKSIAEGHEGDRDVTEDISETSKVQDPYNQFQENLAISGRLAPERHNASLRITSLDDYGKAKTGLGSLKSHVWTPHEIHLQRVVQKKGGELFVLTAAGTLGRKLAPWRKSRFERLTDDFEHIKQQHEVLCMEIEDVQSRAIAQEEQAKAAAKQRITAELLLQLGNIQAVKDGSQLDSINTPKATANGESLMALSIEKKEENAHSGSKESHADSNNIVATVDDDHKSDQKVYSTLTSRGAKREKGHTSHAHGSEEEPSIKLPPNDLIKVVSREVSETENLKEVKFHIETQRKLMQYQIDYFKKIMEGGSLAAVEKVRKMRKLDEGEPIDTDEKLSMSLEDMMATKIQRKIRYVYGRLIRRAIFHRQTKAAIKIQTLWRKIKHAEGALQRKHRFVLAMKLQNIFRGRRGIDAGTELKLMTLQQASVRLIQRVYRGYKGRVRASMKAEFLTRIDEAVLRSSFVELSPGDIDDLADIIQDFVADFELNLPTAILNTIRGVLYMFNGDKAEKISVDIDTGGGFIDLRARSLAWDQARLLLRRKGRLLRRLRSLAKHVKLPDARKLEFSDDCVAHLKILKENTDETVFYPLRKGRRAIVQLFRYTMCLARVQELQSYFPEYFEPGQPNWYRRLVSLRLKFEQAEIGMLIESGCEIRLEELKQQIIKAGKKFGFVAQAALICKATFASCKAQKLDAKKRFEFAVNQLDMQVQKKIAVMENLRITRELGLTVAEKELSLYREVAIAIDTKKLKAMYRNIDKRALDLLDTRSSIVVSQQGIELDKDARDFDKSLKFDRIHQRCIEIGRHKAELMVIAESWKSFLDKIGGSQFLPDLVGEQREYYIKTRADVHSLMNRRRDAISFVSKGVKTGFDRALKYAQAAKRRFLDEHPWDCPTDVEAEYETNEDLEWARRDADYAIQEGKLASQVEIAHASFSPVLILADIRLPYDAQQTLTKRISEHNVVVVPQHGLDTDLMVKIQEQFDAHRNVLIYVDRGLNRVARGKFIASFNALVTGLIPNPRVIAVDASDNFTAHVWHGRLKLHQIAIAGEDFQKIVKGKFLPESYEAIVMLGKLRLISAVMKHGLRKYEEYDHLEPQMSTKQAIADMDGAAASSVPNTMSPRGDAAANGAFSPTEERSKAGSSSSAQSPSNSKGGGSSAADDTPSRESKSRSYFGSWVQSLSNSRLTGSGSGNRRKSRESLLQQEGSDPMSPVEEAEGNDDEFEGDEVNNDELITDDGEYFSDNGDYFVPTDFPEFPNWLTLRFVADLNSLYESLQSDMLESDKYLTILTAQLNHDKLVAAMVTSLLGLWTAPVSRWSDAQINLGCLAFLEYLGDPHKLCHMLAVRHMPDCGMFSVRRIEEAIKIAKTWGNKINISFYSHPVRFLLLQWCFSIASMMKRMAYEGGEVQHAFHNTRVDHVRYVDWDGDILSGDTDGITGDVLCAGLHPYLVYENESCPIIISHLVNNYDNTERQVIEHRQEFHRVQVFYCGNIAYVCVEMTKVTGKTVKYFASREINEVLRMFNPNGIEVFEGRVKKYHIEEGGKDLWYEILSQWCRIDFTTEHPSCELIRARSLMFSRLVPVNGYHVRIEVFEERHGEVVLVVHNLLPSGAAVIYRVTRESMQILSDCADHHEEKGKLQVNDYNAIAGMFADRMIFKPHNRILQLMKAAELLPKEKEKPISVKIRTKGGPGRLVGKKYIKFSGRHLLLTIFELSSESEHHAIRVVLYDQMTSQSVEYRISPLERLILFPSDDLSIAEQFVQRLTTVYCDRNDSHRTLINLPEDFKAVKKPFEVDGTTEYDLLSPFDIYPLGESSSVFDGSADGFTTQRSGLGTSRPNTSASVKSDRSGKDDDPFSSITNIRLSNKQSTRDKAMSSKLDDDKTDPATAANTAANSGAVLPKKPAAEEDELSEDENGFVHKNDDGPIGLSIREMLEARAMGEAWGWALYFNRTIVDVTKGNIKFSIGINSNLHGFSCHCLDLRTQKEAYRFISYKEACTIFYNKTEESLLEEARSIDENTVYDLLDELMTTISIVEDDENHLVYCFNSDENDSISIPIVYIREHIPDGHDEDDGLRIVVTPYQEKEIVKKTMNVTISASKGLARIGTFGSRNPFAMVWWNKKEIGRTDVAPKTTNPKWIEAKATFPATFPVENLDKFKENILEIEIWDTPKRVFLGLAMITGNDLIELVINFNQKPKQIDLIPTYKLDKAANANVQGKAVVTIAVEAEFVEQLTSMYPELVLKNVATAAGKSVKASASDKVAKKDRFSLGAMSSKLFDASSKKGGTGAGAASGGESGSDTEGGGAGGRKGLFGKMKTSMKMTGWLGRANKEDNSKAEAVEDIQSVKNEPVADINDDQNSKMQEESEDSLSLDQSELDSSFDSLGDINGQSSFLHLNVVQAHNLPASKLIVSLNKSDVGEIIISSCELDSDATESSTINVCSHFHIPIPFPWQVDECIVRFELWDVSSTYLWGIIELCGLELVKLVKCRDITEAVWFSFDPTIVPKRWSGSASAHKEVFGKISIAGIAFNNTFSISELTEPKTYMIDILNMSNVTLGETIPRPKPLKNIRAELHFNHRLIGSTVIAKEDSAQNMFQWYDGIGETSSYEIKVHKGQPALCSLLEIKYIDVDADQVIASLVRAGEDLENFLDKSDRNPVRYKLTYPKLETSNLRNAPTTATAGGRANTTRSQRPAPPSSASLPLATSGPTSAVAVAMSIPEEIKDMEDTDSQGNSNGKGTAVVGAVAVVPADGPIDSNTSVSGASGPLSISGSAAGPSNGEDDSSSVVSDASSTRIVQGPNGAINCRRTDLLADNNIDFDDLSVSTDHYQQQQQAQQHHFQSSTIITPNTTTDYTVSRVGERGLGLQDMSAAALTMFLKPQRVEFCICSLRVLNYTTKTAAKLARLEELFVRLYVNDSYIGETKIAKPVPAIVTVPTLGKKSVSDWVYRKLQAPPAPSAAAVTASTKSGPSKAIAGKDKVKAKEKSKDKDKDKGTNKSAGSSNSNGSGGVEGGEDAIYCVGQLPRGTMLENSTLTIEIVLKTMPASAAQAVLAAASSLAPIGAAKKTTVGLPQYTVLATKNIEKKQLALLLERSRGKTLQTVGIDIDLQDNNGSSSASVGGGSASGAAAGAGSISRLSSARSTSSASAPAAVSTAGNELLLSEDSVKAELSMLCDYEVMDEWDIIEKRRRQVVLSVKALKNMIIPKHVMQAHRHREAMRLFDMNNTAHHHHNQHRVYLVVFWNNQPVYQSPYLPYDKHASAANSPEINETIEMHVPLGMKLHQCSLEVSLWLGHVRVSQIMLNRSKLVTFFRQSSAATQLPSQPNNNNNNNNGSTAINGVLDGADGIAVAAGHRGSVSSLGSAAIGAAAATIDSNGDGNNSIAPSEADRIRHSWWTLLPPITTADNRRSSTADRPTRDRSHSRTSASSPDRKNLDSSNHSVGDRSETLGFVQFGGEASPYLLQLEEEQVGSLFNNTQLVSTFGTNALMNNTANTMVASNFLELRRNRIGYVPLTSIKSDLTHRQQHWQKHFPNVLLQDRHATTYHQRQTTGKAVGNHATLLLIGGTKDRDAEIDGDGHGEGEKDGFVRMIKVEFAGAVQLKKISKVKETDRITWRGRVAPKHMILSQGETLSSMSALLHRTAKLYKNQAIATMKVLTDIFDIKVDEDGIKRQEGELPIIVKEGLSHSPGLVMGTYRIEVIGNRNVALGATEIADDVDLQLVAGVEGRHFFAGKKREEWDMGAIFEYIVRERFILEMLPMVRSKAHSQVANAENDVKSRRRSAVSRHVAEGHGGSNITLMRDSPEDVFTAESTKAMDEESVSECSSTVRKSYWVRIAARTHKVAGNLLRTFVFLEGYQPMMQTTPDKFFMKLDPKEALRDLNLLIRCTDKKKGLHTEVKLTGTELLAWIPEDFPINLKSKFKRKLLGLLFIEGLCLHYGSEGKYKVDLANPELLHKLISARKTSIDLKFSGQNRRRQKQIEIEEEDEDDEDDDEDDDEGEEEDDHGGVFGRVADIATNLASTLGGVASDVMDKLSSLFVGSRPMTGADENANNTNSNSYINSSRGGGSRPAAPTTAPPSGRRLSN